ncbi:MAG: selenocysteine-specific translation elongation factor [Betaproteobacteria bacterium]
MEGVAVQSIVVGTAGHIDHGKSALVRALTGTDPDRLKEEKARGITIDLGFAHLAAGDTQFAFVDVPGHERFVKNMLAGVGGIDLVLLVVAADESVMPQTREHFDICRLLRVPAGLVVLTKADLVDADTLELVRLEVRELVAGSFLDGAPILAVSSKTGEGLDALRAALLAAAAAAPGRGADGPVRLPIDRVFSMRGFGTVVTGTLVSGRLHEDDELTVAPGGRTVKVRGVQVHGARRPEAVAGQRTAVNLGGIEVDEIARGQTLMTPGTLEETRVADAVLEVLADAKPIRHGARVRFHQGTAEILGRVAIAGPPVAGDERAVPVLGPAARAYVRLRLEKTAVLTRGDRYILRAYSPAVTIAGGRILDPHPPRGAIRTAAALERLRRLDAGAPGADRAGADREAALVMIEGAGAAGLPMAALESRAGLTAARAARMADDLVAENAVARAGDWLVARAIYDRLKASIVERLAEHHRSEPLSGGVPREEARERLFAHGCAALFDRAIDEMARAGTIVARDRLALATHRAELSPEELRARDAIDRLYREGGLTPPDAAAAAAAAGVGPAVVERILKLMQRQKVLVRIDTLLFHDETLRRLKEEVAAMKRPAGDGRIDVAAFKERFGVTRKFAIPLLEYLDRERVTRRVGDARVIL